MCTMQQQVGKIEFNHPWAGSIEPAIHQVTTAKPVHGKFFADYRHLCAAWERFLTYNSHTIVSWNIGHRKVRMSDGSVHHFILLRDRQDCNKICGINFFSLYVDRDIDDPEVMNFIRTRARWPD